MNVDTDVAKKTISKVYWYINFVLNMNKILFKLFKCLFFIFYAITKHGIIPAFLTVNLIQYLKIMESCKAGVAPQWKLIMHTGFDKVRFCLCCF